MGWQDRQYARRDARAGGSLFGGFSARRTGVVKILIIANIAMYVLCYMTPLGPVIRGTSPRLVRVMTQDGAQIGIESNPGLCEMITTKVVHGQVWRLVTSQYLHSAQLMHILFNMIGLLFLGQALERVWGNKKFLVIYTVSGICGNLLLMAAGLVGWINPDVPAVGASGCVLGLLGAAAVMFPQAEVYVYMLFPVKIRTAAVVFGLMYVYNVYAKGANYGGDLCHLAGLAFGAWWAWRGDRWWTRLIMNAQTGSQVGRFGRASRAPRKPGAWARRVERRKADAKEVDRILRKVYEGGIHTLTPAERQALAEATEHQRQEDQKAKRGR